MGSRSTTTCTVGAVAGFGDKGANPEGLSRKLAIDAEAARHGGACQAGAALAHQAQLVRLQPPSSGIIVTSYHVHYSKLSRIDPWHKVRNIMRPCSHNYC